MDKQILFNFILKNKLYEIGNKVSILSELRDLNWKIIPEKYIEEFKKLIILEETHYTLGDSY
jgi:hypothetical protein